MKWLTLASLLLIVTCGILVAYSQDLVQIKKEFEDLYKKKAEISQKKDVEGIISQTTADYVVKLSNGQTMTRQQLEERLRKYFTSGQLVKQVSFTYTIKDIIIEKDEVIVVVEQKDKRIQIRSDGKPHDVEAHVIHKDRWARTSEGWKLKLTEEGEQTKFTVDGKPGM